MATAVCQTHTQSQCSHSHRGRYQWPSLGSPRADSSSSGKQQKKAKAHVRAKSTTAVCEPSRLDSSSARSTAPRPEPQFPSISRRRERAASSATTGAHPRSHPHPRPRLPSMLSSVLTNPRAPVHTQIASPGDADLVGSFTPTRSPCPSLRSILSGRGGVLPTPTPSAPPSPRAAPLRLATDRLARYPASSDDSRRRSPASSSPVSHSPPAFSGPHTPIPSICRTPSSYSGSEYFPTAPSSAGPATPVHTAAALPVARKSESLHPVLENLERTSMFCVQTACATCGKAGSNFPCCPRCGEMWCSRVCRLQRGNGKRHICTRSG
ncbi:hypothetical protein BD413DRAFT_220812 [Trametes elegans]|nr:hypothetical protein BD413DRAFT_220812 [Trametes elegans]